MTLAGFYRAKQLY